MPILNWIGKDKIVNHDKDVPFRLMKKNKKYSLGKSENLILEGDNLEALKALMPFYYGKIKCIYIDPPYNTGKEKWVYNDRVNSPKIKEWLGKVVGPESEDLCRHDKWLCMMYPRLKLLRDLLSDDGVIFVSIDDNEHCNLRMIMDDIFGTENFLANISWQGMDTIKNDARYFSSNTEYVVVYAKSIASAKLKGIKKGEKQRSVYKNYDNDPRGPYLLTPLHAKSGSEEGVYNFTFPNNQIWRAPKGTYPRFSKETLVRLVEDGRIYLDPKGKRVPQKKTYLSEVSERMRPWTFWKYEDFGSTRQANAELRAILGRGEFQNPKPSKLIKKIIDLVTDKDDLILDSFAGSGTTGHAVLDLNKEDNGNRKFILVELEKNIAKNVTTKRVKRVTRGYSYKTSKSKVVKVVGLGGGFEYVQLGQPLFDKDGMISEEVKFNDLANYIYFTETHTNLEKNKIKGNYLGDYGSCHYFLLFNGIGKNVLNRKFLKELKGKDGKKIVYADKCLLDKEVLEKYNIVFKQIPYQIKVY